MEISISEAAKMLKVSRTTLYEKMKTGELSRCSSGKLETSELFRVFGHHPERHTRNEQKTLVQSVRVQKSSAVEQLYQTQIKNLEEALRQSQEREHRAQEREEWQRGQIEKLTDTLKLLEAPKEQKKSTRWWKFWS